MLRVLAEQEFVIDDGQSIINFSRFNVKHATEQVKLGSQARFSRAIVGVLEGFI